MLSVPDSFVDTTRLTCLFTISFWFQNYLKSCLRALTTSCPVLMLCSHVLSFRFEFMGVGKRDLEKYH